jgi:N-acetylglutamate synthase-like GNAT family acetyltransferase
VITTLEGTAIRSDLRPGDIGGIIALHGVLYTADAGFDVSFEAFVAASVAEYFETFDPARDRVWIVERAGQMCGCLALKGRSPVEAQLRYFLLHPDLRGQGLGRKLIEAFLECARALRYKRIFLLTDEAHTAAATHLYLAYGFRKIDERPVDRWGNSVAEQRYELEL